MATTEGLYARRTSLSRLSEADALDALADAQWGAYETAYRSALRTDAAKRSSIFAFRHILKQLVVEPHPFATKLSNDL